MGIFITVCENIRRIIKNKILFLSVRLKLEIVYSELGEKVLVKFMNNHGNMQGNYKIDMMLWLEFCSSLIKNKSLEMDETHSWLAGYSTVGLVFKKPF